MVKKVDEKAMKGLNKLWHNYDELRQDLQMPDDMNINGAWAPSPLLLTTLVPVANGSLLLAGEPGFGKSVTTRISSYVTSGDKNKYWLQCHDNMSMESDFVQIDTGKLLTQMQFNQKAVGKELENISASELNLKRVNELFEKYGIDMNRVVEPRPWMTANQACIGMDEVARTPQRYQNTLLEFLAFGEFHAYGITINRETKMMVANTNWPAKRIDESSISEAGTHRLVEALLNRFEMTTLVPAPDHYQTNDLLNNTLKSVEEEGMHTGDYDYDKLEVLDYYEVLAMQEEASKIPIEKTDKGFTEVWDVIHPALTAMDACKKGNGSKSSMWGGFNPDKYCTTCSENDNICSYFYLPMTPRAYLSTVKWAKAMAFFTQEDVVTEDTMELAFKHAIMGRVKPSYKFDENGGNMMSYINDYMKAVKDWTNRKDVFEAYGAILKTEEQENKRAYLAELPSIHPVINEDPVLSSFYNSFQNKHHKKLARSEK